MCVYCWRWRYKKSPYGSYIHDIFFIDSQSNYPDPDASTASRLHQMLLQLLQTSHTTWGHRYSNVLNFSWNVCYIQDSNVKFFGGRAGGGKGVLGASWCCGSHCQCGFYPPSFQSFVLSHLVIGPVRMIPTYLSPKSTLTLTSHLGQNVSIGEG